MSFFPSFFFGLEKKGRWCGYHFEYEYVKYKDILGQTCFIYLLLLAFLLAGSSE